ncbi:MAG TPA: hypothetical protein VK217_02130 [Acidimicrobiales bacterium]|nr:hypothetical protein [Acidimicrobiales bacterium]
MAIEHLSYGSKNVVGKARQFVVGELRETAGICEQQRPQDPSPLRSKGRSHLCLSGWGAKPLRHRLSSSARDGRHHGDGTASTSPRGDVGGGACVAPGRASVPDRQQPRTGVEVTGPQLGETHGELGAISVKDVVGRTYVVGGEVNLGRARQAALEASYPLLAGRGHRSANELLDRQREDDVKLAGSRQQRLGPKDVSPIRE